MSGSARASALVAALAVALTGLAVSAAGAFGPRPAATVGHPAVRLDAPRPALLVSDSAWLGIKTYGSIDAVRGFDHVLDLASCRRRVATSCRNYDGHVPITLVEEVRAHGDRFHTLIVATGYNDGSTNFRDDVDRVVTEARAHGYQRIVWVTLRADVTYTSPDDLGYDDVFLRNNETLADLVTAAQYPELLIADWATYSGDHPEWFATDGIHLRGDGPWAAADYVSRKLAFLDDRPCPLPVRAGEGVATPCPDPDLSTGSIDLGSIYPIGLPNPTAEFHMEWEGSGAWPAAPWWT